MIAACNAADGVEVALRTLLAQDYPALEVVVVDDLSGDRTGEIIDRMASARHRGSRLSV